VSNAAAAAAGASVGCASNAVRASDGVCALAGVQSVYVYICVCVLSTVKKKKLGVISARGVILDIVGSIVHSTRRLVKKRVAAKLLYLILRYTSRVLPCSSRGGCV
jgi:hypothetical protein